SARSVADFDIHKALEFCSDLFMKFGGHQAAAGLSMEKEHFEEFKIRFEEYVKMNIQEHQKEPSIYIDSVVKPEDLNREFFNFHRKLAPFGPQNMKPVLVLKNVKVNGYVRLMGKENTHLKFNILQPTTGRNIECVGFRFGQFAEDFKVKTFDLAFTIEENHWKGNVSHFLNIRDVKFHN
ncbi:MAG TPA: single-stranded-DNA-specific exonuclease RecJ, partial [Chryseobacterium sp.]|nr:single-stranded-DNA-specific exonuclease RecJ [Chryseobacterium sp.]